MSPEEEKAAHLVAHLEQIAEQAETARVEDIRLLLIGLHPSQQIREAELLRGGFDLNALVRNNSGLMRSRAEAVGLLMRDPNTRAVAEIANRRNLPYTEVRDRWDEESITMDLAVQALHAIEQAERCPDCGVVPGEMHDVDTDREIAEPAYLIDFHYCKTCEDLATMQDKLKPGEGEPRPVYEGRYVLKPRGYGDELANVQDRRAETET